MIAATQYSENRHRGALMSTEFPHQPDEPVNPPPAQAIPPPAPTEQQAEAVD